MVSIKHLPVAVFVAAVLLSPASHGVDLFKCVVGGKTIYQDTPCGDQAKKLSIDPNQNTYPSYQVKPSARMGRAGSGGADPKCQELLDRLENTPYDASSFGRMAQSKAARKAIREEYELRCMSAEAARDSQQSRQMDSMINQQQYTNIQLQQQKEQLRQMQVEQESQKFKQRMGW